MRFVDRAVQRVACAVARVALSEPMVRWTQFFRTAFAYERQRRTTAWRASLNDPKANRVQRVREFTKRAADLRMCAYRKYADPAWTAAAWETLAMEYVSYEHVSVEKARRILDVPKGLVFGSWAEGR